MKKITALLLTVALLATVLVSCSGTTDKLRIGYMSGPTGMGMAELIHNNTDGEYEFTNFENNTQGAMAKLAANEVDIVCVPTNLAAAYNAQNGGIQVLAVNCLNSLFVVTDKNTTLTSFDDLNGKTIYTCKSGTPKPILQYVLTELGINATISTTFEGNEILEPKTVGDLVTGGKVEIAVMPEPIITSSMLAINKNGNTDIEYSIDLDLADAWAEVNDTPITMGCLVARADFVAKNKGLIDNFLEDYEASVNYVNKIDNLNSAAEYIVESGIMAALPAAKSALSNLGDSIAYIDGSQMKSALLNFYSAINMAAPADEFFYD